MFKFKSKTSKKLNEISFLVKEILIDLDDIHDDIDDLRVSVNKSYELTLLIQKQCQEIIDIMENNKGETNE